MFVSFSGEQKLHRRLSAERKSRNNNDDAAEEPATPAVSIWRQFLWEEKIIFAAFEQTDAATVLAA